MGIVFEVRDDKGTIFSKNLWQGNELDSNQVKELKEILESICESIDIFLQRGFEYGADTWKLPEYPKMAPLLNGMLCYIKIKRCLNILKTEDFKDEKRREMLIDNCRDLPNYAHFLNVTIKNLFEE